VNEIFAFIFGLLWGSFLNVCIVRIPKGLDIVKKRSHCPKCSAVIAWYDNLPVLSFVWLRGKCRACRGPISWQYPLVEIFAAVMTLLTYRTYGLTIAGWEAWLFSMALIVLIKIDLDHRILPDVITYPGMVVGFLFALSGHGLATWKSSLLGFAVGFVFFLSIAMIYEKWKKREGLGGGDIKLLGMIGAVLGFKAIPIVVIFSSFLGAGVGVAQVVSKRTGWQTALPFGPFLALGAWVAMIWGDALLTWYFGTY
jgi:leader peptidase (prepilin peptidase)/N-methyltransferase